MSPREEQASPLRARLEQFFAIDLRSLALFRIALALVLFYDLIDRARNLRAHYTDAGTLPAEVLEQISGAGIRFSLHYHLSSSEWAVMGVFGLAWLAATALLFGHRTRVATFISWFLLSSLQVRNPYLASMGGDQLLRILLFWSLLLPIGARFSLDASREPSSRVGANRLLSVAGFGLLMQICLMYWVTGLKKDGVTWVDGSALYYALHLDFWATPLASTLRDQAWILPLLTYATRWFELLGPFLAFSPVWTAQLRLFAFAAFAFFHLSLGVFLDIGMFPLVSMIGWFAFIPSWFWDELLPRMRGEAVEDFSDAELGEYDDEEELPPRSLTPLFGQVGAALLLAYVVFSLAIQVGWLRGPVPSLITDVAHVLRVQQSWSMFSPNPPAMDFWPVVSGTTAAGESVDLFRDAPTTFAKPRDIVGTLPSFRWRLYFSYLLTIPPEDPRQAPTYAGLVQYMCREWNATHEGQTQIHKVTVSIGVEFTRETYEDEPAVATLHEAACELRVPSQ